MLCGPPLPCRANTCNASLRSSLSVQHLRRERTPVLCHQLLCSMLKWLPSLPPTDEKRTKRVPAELALSSLSKERPPKSIRLSRHPSRTRENRLTTACRSRSFGALTDGPAPSIVLEWRFVACEDIGEETGDTGINVGSLILIF